jgi:hypothetical protein
MSREIESLVCRECAGRLNVIAFHGHFAEIVQQGCGVQRSAIVSREVKLMRDLVGNDGDALGVRVIVAFKLIYGLRELYERFRSGFVD